MAFEARLFSKTRFNQYQHCLGLIEANARLAPLWERICLALYIRVGPPLAKLFGVDVYSMWQRADQIVADVLAVTQSEPEEIARLLRRYIRLRRERDDHLPFDEACERIYDQSFYPVVTHFTYALQPSATARLNFVKEVVGSIFARQASVADLGCGSGVILSEILKMKPLWTGHGLDISHEAVKYARRLAAHKRVADRTSFRAGNVTHLPYADESLNLIIASEIIEHMPEPEIVVGEIRRVLKPGGQLILTMPLESHTPGHIHTLSSLEDLQFLCERAGLKIRRLEPHWHFGFGDDRRHVFALAEAGNGRPGAPRDFVSPDAVHSLSTAYPEPEAA
ncbi:MAG: class I SAM-dependent methyltransferase [Acidobacteria bacterium]|nr:class I SAM-dependent methyltransferase [Acidobacteriota bacterium]